MQRTKLVTVFLIMNQQNYEETKIIKLQRLSNISYSLGKELLVEMVQMESFKFRHIETKTLGLNLI